MRSPQTIIDGIHVVRGLVNIYIVETTDGCAVIDTGFPRSTGKIIRAVTAIGRRPNDIRHILISHAHPDHMGSAGSLKRETGAAVGRIPSTRPSLRLEPVIEMRRPAQAFEIKSWRGYSGDLACRMPNQCMSIICCMKATAFRLRPT